MISEGSDSCSDFEQGGAWYGGRLRVILEVALDGSWRSGISPKYGCSVCSSEPSCGA